MSYAKVNKNIGDMIRRYIRCRNGSSKVYETVSKNYNKLVIWVGAW